MKREAASVEHRVKLLKELLQKCSLCPRNCQADRLAGEKGYCGLDDRMIMSHALAHHGEEPPISGDRGAGTIFFSSCNLRCRYCQNHQISHTLQGRGIDPRELSNIMLNLQESGCHNVEAVTPTPHVVGLAEALCFAREKGLTIPFVYNCGGYEKPDIIRLLQGMVDIYLPDFKYGRSEEAVEFSDAADYPQRALESIREMVEQVGNSMETKDGIAVRGVIIRHLVLPGKRESSQEALRLIRKHLSPSIPISIMSQYTPMPLLKDHPYLGRRVTKQEYEAIVENALDLGFEEIYTQAVDDRTINPDFDCDQPFQWK
jgi:putative pyruvate formate lyase activating enzyme